MTSPGPQSGLIVEVPEAEAAVGRYRPSLDASAPLGVPAHITVLFPFMPPAAIDETVLAELDQPFMTASRFSFRLDVMGVSSTTCAGPRSPSGHTCPSRDRPPL